MTRTRAGKLIPKAVLLIITGLCSGMLHALDGPTSEPLKVLVEADQEGLETGLSFPVTLVVNHAELLEITVAPPDFDGKFRIHRQRTSSRIIRKTAIDIDRWSVFEFTLIPLEEGGQTLPPFTVHARGMTVYTEELPLFIAPARAVRAAPVFRWETPLPVLKAGEWTEFRLLVSDAALLPKEALRRVYFEPPPEAIVESVLVDAAAWLSRFNVPVMRIRILPVHPGAFTLKPVDFEAQGRDETTLKLHVPELKAPIR
jgi:hypothetical protein